VVSAYDNDPLVHGTGTHLGIYTLLSLAQDISDHPPTINVPLIIQHGTEDKICSFDATKKMFDNLPKGNPDREFKVWDGYYHELHNDPEAERTEVIEYIAKWILARCPDSAGAARAKL
jgi:acylglycerol lipase